MFETLQGVFALGIHCGIKFSALDLAFLYVPQATGSAGVFTQHHFAASSVHVTKADVAHLKAMVINSGNANACTGEQGLKDTLAMQSMAAEKLGLEAREVGVASTGIIGKALPMPKIEKGLDALLARSFTQDYESAADAILTTDTCRKLISRECDLGQGLVIKALGFTKGSGMIAPNMATTLGFVVLSVDASSAQLQKMLSEAATLSYNAISVDTDTSTNDMLVAFASGQHRIDWDNQSQLDQVQAFLNELCMDLAKTVVLDGEGATKLLTVQVEGARFEKEAAILAKQVLDSPLVKTAIHGEDPNWGRFVMAIGKNPDIELEAEKMDLYVGDILLFSKGQAVVYSESEMMKLLKKKEIILRYDLKMGHANARLWGCDLSARYVEINTDYN